MIAGSFKPTSLLQESNNIAQELILWVDEGDKAKIAIVAEKNAKVAATCVVRVIPSSWLKKVTIRRKEKNKALVTLKTHLILSQAPFQGRKLDSIVLNI